MYKISRRRFFIKYCNNYLDFRSIINNYKIAKLNNFIETD